MILNPINLTGTMTPLEVDVRIIARVNEIIEALNDGVVPNGYDTMVSAVSALQSALSTLQGQMSTATGNISTLQGQVTTLQTNVGTLQGQMTTAQSNITNLQGRVTALEGATDAGIIDIYDQVLSSNSHTIPSDLRNFKYGIIYIKIDGDNGTVLASVIITPNNINNSYVGFSQDDNDILASEIQYNSTTGVITHNLRRGDQCLMLHVNLYR